MIWVSEKAQLVIFISCAELPLAFVEASLHDKDALEAFFLLIESCKTW